MPSAQIQTPTTTIEKFVIEKPNKTIAFSLKGYFFLILKSRYFFINFDSVFIVNILFFIVIILTVKKVFFLHIYTRNAEIYHLSMATLSLILLYNCILYHSSIFLCVCCFFVE